MYRHLDGPESHAAASTEHPGFVSCESAAASTLITFYLAAGRVHLSNSTYRCRPSSESLHPLLPGPDRLCLLLLGLFMHRRQQLWQPEGEVLEWSLQGGGLQHDPRNFEGLEPQQHTPWNRAARLQVCLATGLLLLWK